MGEAEGQILTYEVRRRHRRFVVSLYQLGLFASMQQVDDRGSEGLQLDSIQVSANYAKYPLLDEISVAPSFN
jgi:hypothetical protein